MRPPCVRAKGGTWFGQGPPKSRQGRGANESAGAAKNSTATIFARLRAGGALAITFGGLEPRAAWGPCLLISSAREETIFGARMIRGR